MMGKANRAKFVSFFASCILWLGQQAADGHGYLSTPRSRNLLAFQETIWWPQTENDPEPETCPHCLNRGGSRARCGLFEDSGGVRNYDAPKNALGSMMPTKIQENYTQGQDVVLDVTLTAHHKGHFVFSACPVSPGEIPTQECFDQHQLTFVEDLLHGANYDSNYPERAYLAPVDDPHYFPDLGSSKGVIDYSFKMRLPPNLYGDLVLIQWYYLTANSCYHDGYLQYNWPTGWNTDATSSGLCGDVSSDGTGSPEQFWNCAEVRILQGTNQEVVNPTPPPANKPTNKPSPMEIASGISIPVSLPSLSNNNNPSSAGSHGKTIVGYYASWQWYDRNKKAAPENMDFTKVQRVNFAFFQIDTQGNMWGTDAWADPNLLFGPYNWNPGEGSREYCSWDSATDKVCNHHNYEQGLIHLVHAAGAEIYPSLGGWTLSDAFPAMAASATARARFAQNCVELIREYNFDGIDIDWEYPGYEDHSGTPQDRDNFKLLLNDVRAKLDELGAPTGTFYGLTAALPCGPQHIENMDIAHVASTLSELNLMTYDFHGAFSETTGINAPMYYQGWGEEDFDVHSCVQNWLSGGGSRDKINIGLPFYGRSFGAATGLNQPHSGADQTVWGIDDGTPQYFNIVAQLPFMTTAWDKKTWTPYAHFDNGGLVSFDDENAICVKVQYAIENELGGFIIWELSGDLMEDLSTPLLDVTNKKLHNPDFNCGELGFYPEEEETSVLAAPTTTSPIGQVPTPVGQVPTPTPPVPLFPTPFTPVSSPESLKPSGPAAESLYSQPVNDQSVNDQPVNDQPVNDQPMTDQPTDQPELFICGDRQVTFNTADSKALDLSFRYEVHRNSGVPVSDAIKELKSTMLNGIAEKLNCAGASSVVRRLRSNPVEASQENVMAIESTQSDLPENDTPCSIPVNLDVSTICHSVIGSMTTYFEKGTSATVLREVSEELLFYIRTSMASGKFESAKIRKVIYVENLSSSPLESNAAPPNTIIVSEPQNEEGANSSVVAIVLSLLIIILVGVTLFVFVIRKRRSEPRHAEERAIIMENKRDDSEATSMPASTSTEETWKKALTTEEVWRNAMNTYPTEDKSTRLAFDSDEEALVPEAGRGTSSTEPLVEQMIRDLGKSDKVARSQAGNDEKYKELSESRKGHDSMVANANEDESRVAYDESDETANNAREKKKTKKKNKRSVSRNKKMTLEPDEGMQDSDGTMEDEQNHYFDIDREGDINDDGNALEPVGDDKINELANNKEEEHNQVHEEDEQSFGSIGDGKLDPPALDGKKDELRDAPPTGTMEEDGNDPHSDSNDGRDDNKATTSSSPSNNTDHGTAGGEASSIHGESSDAEYDLD